MKEVLIKNKIIVGTILFVIIILSFLLYGYKSYNERALREVQKINLKKYEEKLLLDYNKFIDEAKEKDPQKKIIKFQDNINNQLNDVNKSLKKMENYKKIILKSDIEKDIVQKEEKLTKYRKKLEEITNNLKKVENTPEENIPGYFVLNQLLLNEKYKIDKDIQYRYNGEKVKIAFLTFDDGPTYNTEKVVKILKKNNIQGTFFVIGDRIQDYEEEFQKLLKSNNSVAMHSMTHDAVKLAKGNNLEKEIKEYDKMLHDKYNYSTNLIRVPTGSTLIDEKQEKKLEKEGYYIIDWDIDSRDWEQPNKKIVYKNVTSNLTQDIEVILFHEKDVTVEVLQDVIDKLREENYSILPMPVNNFIDYKFEDLPIS